MVKKSHLGHADFRSKIKIPLHMTTQKQINLAADILNKNKNQVRVDHHRTCIL